MDRTPRWTPDVEELQAIRAASAGIVRETPLLSFDELSARLDAKLLLKTENLQQTGSFKLRGALAKLRAAGAMAGRGVVAGSAGNHAQALAYAARFHGLPCTVFMPRRAPLMKVDAVAALGASIRQESDSVDDCISLARALAEEEELLFVHPFDDLDVIKGQAGVGLEIHEQAPDVARVIVPVGGGGLISGIAAVLKQLRPETHVVGVQASGCAAFERSLAQGSPWTVPDPSTIADGIAVKRPGALALEFAERWVDEFVTVDDDAIVEAMVLLLERTKLLAEGAGAVGVAALSSGAVAPAQTGATVIVLSGGNVDSHVIASVINRHQTGIGRRMRLFTRVSDRPGGLADFLAVLAAGGGNVLEVTHVRDGVALALDETGLEVLLESRSKTHRSKLVEELREAGYAVEELGLSARDL